MTGAPPDLAELYATHMSCESIARLLRVHRATVNRWLQEAGIARRSSRARVDWTPELLERIREARQRGASWKVIADEVTIPRSTLAQHMRKRPSRARIENARARLEWANKWAEHAKRYMDGTCSASLRELAALEGCGYSTVRRQLLARGVRLHARGASGKRVTWKRKWTKYGAAMIRDGATIEEVAEHYGTSVGAARRHVLPYLERQKERA